MNNAVILAIEGKKADQPVFAAQLEKKGFTVVSARSGVEALERQADSSPDLAVLNAASLGSSGVRIIQSLREKQGEDPLPILMILAAGQTPKKSAADATLVLPFTVQKLVNRLRSYLPGDGASILHVGQIRLDTQHRRVKCLGKNVRLTPRLANLLKVLMERKGEVVGREELFKRVWETDYFGDTRTMDVHVSWLRKAIELDPDHPKFLHTVRGVGYRLDV